MFSSQQKIAKCGKKQEIMAHLQEKKLTEAIPEEALTLDLLDKDLNCS